MRIANAILLIFFKAFAVLDPELTKGLLPYTTATTGIEGRNEAEKANAFIAWIEETNKKMGLPDGFDVIKDEDIPQMIAWARKEANPLYPVPVVWGEKDFRRLIKAIRK